MEEITPPSSVSTASQRSRPFAANSRGETFFTLGLLLVTAIVAATILWHENFLRRPPFAEEANIAMHLARGEGFLSPMDPSANAPPTMWSPPIYPYLMAIIYAGYGINTAAAVTRLMWLNAIFLGAVVAGIYTLGRLLFSSRSAAIAGCILVALNPFFLHFTGDFWDSLLALGMFTWLLVAAVIERRRPELWKTAALGACMGLLSLTNASYILAYPLIVWVAVHRRRQTWKTFIHAVVAMIAFALVLTPWTIRGYRTFGRIYYVRGGSEVPLWIANLPASTGWLDPITLSMHPYNNVVERRELLTLGEPGYFAECARRFEKQFHLDPPDFWLHCYWRAGYLLLSDPTTPAKYPFMPIVKWRGMYLDRAATNAMVMLLGLAGVWTAWRLGYRVWPMAAAALAVMPFVPTSVIDRYALPLRAALVLYAGVLLWAIWRRAIVGAWPVAPGIRARKSHSITK